MTNTINLIIYTAIIVLMMAVSVSAQKHDNVWCMGYESNEDSLSGFGGQDMSFASGSPVVKYVHRNIDFDAASASISDRQGNLLFYTNGCQIFNSDHMLMEGGDSLVRMGDPWTTSYFCPYGYTAAQGMLILPDPYDTMVYYLFHQDVTLAPDFYSYPEELFITTISFHNNPKGKVRKKRELLLKADLTYGGISAIKKSNGIDWWVVINERQTNKYYFITLDKQGIQLDHTQEIGIPTNRIDRTPKFSKDGGFYANFHVAHGLDVMNFDRKLGMFDNYKHTPFWKVRTPFELGNGLEFSQDSKLLYITCGDELVQFDLTSEDIFASRMLIDTFVIDTSEGIFQSRFYLMQMGPDNKIYMSHLNGTQTMHVIHNPNGRGKDCDFRTRDLKLRTWNAFTMPYFPNFRLGPDTTVAVIDNAILGLSIQPNPASTVIHLADIDELSSYDIYSITGQVVLSGTLYYPNEYINISSLPAGLYIIKVKDRNGKEGIQKWVKE